MYETDNSFLDWQLRKLHENDESFQALSLNLNRMEKDFSQQLAHWRESLFSFQVAQWLAVIRQNTTVETATLDLSVSENTIWKKDQLRTLMVAIVSLPNLRKIVLRQNNLGGPRRLAPMEAILSAIKQDHSIECLELWGHEIMPGTEDQMQEVANVVQDIEGLKSFKMLGFRLDPVHVDMFVPLMSMPSLTEFCLGNTTDGFVTVAEGLSTNSNLEKLTLSFSNGVEDAKCLCLVRALQKNTTLQTLSLLNASPRDNHSGISARSHQDLVHVMRHKNMTLQDFKTRGDPCDEMNLYLKLNRIGRRQLFQPGSVTRELWVDTLISSREDPDCSFYFLTMNPSVCVS